MTSIPANLAALEATLHGRPQPRPTIFVVDSSGTITVQSTR
jgi:hypothetical protein